MPDTKVSNISKFKGKVPRQRAKVNKNKKGSIYVRGSKLWVTFSYLRERVREPSGLPDTEENRATLRLMLDKIHIEIEEGSFEFQKRFPYSKKAGHFAKLEGRTTQKRPQDLTFGEYWKKWFKDMGPGMSVGKKIDHCSIMKCHLLPYFGQMHFSDMNAVTIKKFMAHLAGKSLASRTIRNILMPLRTVTNDAILEYGFSIDPFSGIRMPSTIKPQINPFTQNEWQCLMKVMNPHYRPYFQFAVATGLRPSEQIALKWNSIYYDRVEIESSRVRGIEKDTLKTIGSKRTLSMRPIMKDILDRQKLISRQSEYVFINMRGNPVSQKTLHGGAWTNALKRAGLVHHKMYETRHTFASWALAAGEQPAWVARELGHSNLSMVYSVYGRFIPGFNGNDGNKLDTILGTTQIDKN